MRAFHHVLVNTLIANVTTSYLWFALTFWVYLETENVMSTAFIGGTYMLLIAICSLWFGVFVDHHRKKNIMMFSSVITLAMYLLAVIAWFILPTTSLLDWTSPFFWLFAGLILIGSVVENMRNIALSTTVTLLVPDDRRDKANGLVGAVQGVAFLVTSVFSGLSVGLLGMGPTLVIATAMTGLALLHLLTISIPEASPAAARPPGFAHQLDLHGSFTAIQAIPGLFALILFTCFNNLVGGAFMALLDPYGLTMFGVEIWGIVLGITSTGFIVGGLIIARVGLGRNPVRTLLLINAAIAIIGLTFAIRETWLLFVAGNFVYMCIVPAAEACEQTIIQKVVPYSRQGRVFGIAQSIESAATPISSFLVGPIAQFWAIPWMKSEHGRTTFGWLLGEGQARGIALVFVIASLLMLAAVIIAFMSRPYRLLSQSYGMKKPVQPIPDLA
ncbi:MFS transporter [Devriesea agamarum]|uniref:MFS transporter n=1 Tax=Devriesea agamarum TaxID=472569 RepID=UPI00071DB071|nr:MFS transporter [Devriesea agamarum]